MDELDRKIIGLLQLDGRASNAKIAREVGVSEGTARRRLRRLIQDDVVKVIAVPNLEKLGYATTALIGLQTSPGKSDIVADAIARLEEAHYVAITTGAYDVFIWAGLESAEGLGTFLRTKIGVIDGVQRTETFVNLSIKKRTYGFGLVTDYFPQIRFPVFSTASVLKPCRAFNRPGTRPASQQPWIPCEHNFGA